MKFAQMDGDELMLVEHGAGFHGPSCQCAISVDHALRAYSVALGNTGLNGLRTPTLYTQRLDKNIDTVIVVPRFCPFCGVKYGSLVGPALPMNKLLALEERVAALEKFAAGWAK